MRTAIEDTIEEAANVHMVNIDVGGDADVVDIAEVLVMLYQVRLRRQ
jgi:hypothetical protein